MLLIAEVIDGGGNKVYGYHACALMQQLEKRVLAIGASLAPENSAGLIIDRLTIQSCGLAIALHLELLQKSRQAA